MGKIFGISDVPITLFEPVWKPVEVPAPYEMKLPRFILGETLAKHDILVLRNKAVKRGFLSKLVNGFRKVV